ncbi:monovalent cation/H(+) antiporter subunit G [Profundibacter amoris]|uniref:Na+/H+ antiporter subunit G n=1 Tax=Profundibacter amoris TaxID=2171755 RepID=A0A347UI93_9RHOB|nr:monovalent cation/H(+) antiporter subunit G [Profundibacter amoris]AXX98571.1 Na+/H+ antiporter subunit G [Profundibacter amoris]
MGALFDILGGLVLVVGTAFLLLGGLGLNRMPDVFNRIQAGTKATTLGTILTLTGIAMMHPGWALKLLLIGMFLLFSNPLSSQVLARAAERTHVHKTGRTRIDRFEQDHKGDKA